MRHYSALAIVFLVVVITVLFLPCTAAEKSAHGIASYQSYVQIPGAKAVGSDTCATCHPEVTKDFQHAFHAQQGIDCESCHGPGSLHVEGGGDISKIISFSHRPAPAANGVCLSCHAQNAQIRNWIAGSHAANKVRCTDCHQTHVYSAKGESNSPAGIDLISQGRVTSVENLVPETKPIIQPPWQANDACLRCHQTQRGQMSLPYHHPLREGKMSCVDCHDPHGGAGGNNLRLANINQLCLSCHAQYRGPYAYQHPPVNENCMLCHTAHGSPNTNLLLVSEPALCLQCHAGHHNGASLPLPDRCTNCHLSIHGTDTPTPSGGSRFVDKGPTDPALRSGSFMPLTASHPAVSAPTTLSPGSSHLSTYAVGAATGALGLMSSGYLPPLSGDTMSGGSGGPAGAEVGAPAAAYSLTPGSYRFVDGSGYLGRVGEYDSLHQSAGADAETAYVSPQKQLTLVSRANVITGDDYSAALQGAVGPWAQFGFRLVSFVQQQDNYPFYAFPVLDVPPGATTPPDSTTDLIPSHAVFGITRRLGSAYGEFKLPKLPVHLFVNGNWQARSGLSQLSYLDENTTPAVYAVNPTPPPTLINTTCGAQCHHQSGGSLNSQFQSVNFTTRGIGGGVDVDLGSVRLTYQHQFSSFNDRLTFPTGVFTGPFTPENEGISSINPPRLGPAPPDIPVGNYYIDIPSPSQASSDSLSLNWTASPKLSFNGNVNYSRLQNTYTGYPQNEFDSDETLNWRPLDPLRVMVDYHQQNLINEFTPYYSLYGNTSYHRHSVGLKLDYQLPKNFNVEAYYRRSGITRSDSSLWPQVYSINNTDLLTVVPSSFSNTIGLALRYHDSGHWSARAGYEWTGTHDPGYLIVPQSNNRIFGDVTLTPAPWLTFTNDLSILVQNDFPAIPLPNNPGNFQRRNRFYAETATATLRFVPGWDLGLGYSYQQDNLTTYMAFQNDSGVGYVVDEPAVPYKQISQTYWAESTYLVKQRLGINARITYNSARSGMRPDVNPNDAALLGNQSLISQGIFDPSGLFPSALGNVQFAATQISQVIVPEWIGQSKVYYLFPRKFEGGLIFYYGSYRDYWNPGLNGVLRTFNVYVGRSW